MTLARKVVPAGTIIHIGATPVRLVSEATVEANALNFLDLTDQVGEPINLRDAE